MATRKKAAARGRTSAKKAPAKRAKKIPAKKRPRKAVRSAAASSNFRLAPDVRPLAMDIALDVDPTTSDDYRGQVGITLQIGRRRRSVELHAADLQIEGASLRAAGRHTKGKVVAHPDRETIEIRFTQPIEPGTARLEIGFSGSLRNDLCGLYKVEQRVGPERDGRVRRLAFSQLAPTSARRFIPCFDEPGMKARYRISVTTSEPNVVLSNTPVEQEEMRDDGRKTIHFAPTPPLSTYLIALAVGELSPSRTLHSGRTPITVWHTPGQEKLCEFALRVAHESLIRLERWFGLPHPYAKLDLVAVPEFEFGAMENAGAVFFRETLLLLDEDRASAAERNRVAEVVAHELAHMWYGNLVTMAWWDDLWLNEAFATWMAFLVLDDWQPDWKVWQTFAHRRAAALDADTLDNTHSIYTPVRNASEAAANFDLITYEKGASVIRMIARYLGEETFREGVRIYMRRHRESNTVAADLWNALSEASGQRVDRMVRPWLEEEGYPVVSVDRRDDGAFALRQERMRIAQPSGRGRSADPRWPIPIVARVAEEAGHGTREIRHLLERKRDTLPAGAVRGDFLYANADESGFYRPLATPGVLAALIADIERLTPVERQGLVDHQWALVRAGYAPLSGLLDLAARLGAESDPDVLASVYAALRGICERLAGDAGAEVEARARAWVVAHFGGQIDGLGWDPAPGEDEATGLRRGEALAIVGGVGQSADILREATLRCAHSLDDRDALPPDTSDVVVAMAAAHGDAALYDAFLDASHTARSPQEEKRFLLALADFGAPELVERTLALCTSGAIPSQDVVFLLMRLFENRHARDATWDFIKARWPALRRHLPPQLGVRLIGATPALTAPGARQQVARFFREHPLPSSERAIRQALERFDGDAAFRERATPELVEYLAS